jgi:hypothetical protein
MEFSLLYSWQEKKTQLYFWMSDLPEVSPAVAEIGVKKKETGVGGGL